MPDKHASLERGEVLSLGTFSARRELSGVMFFPAGEPSPLHRGKHPPWMLADSTRHEIIATYAAWVAGHQAGQQVGAEAARKVMRVALGMWALGAWDAP